jgi:serine/threonine protein kinase
MGEVYRARDTRLQRDVAVKVLPKGFSSDPERLSRFEQEARAAAALNHPNILAVYDIGTDAGSPYIVSELLEGESLRDRLAHGALPVRKAIEYAVQIAHGLAAAHDKGIVHRDLKPENIFVVRDGRVKILDFGLAKLTEVQPALSGASMVTTGARDTLPGMVLGTLGYMAPEQVRGLPADHRADIFAFGAVLYEMVSGKRAFQGSTTADTMSAILNADPPDLSETNRPISSGIDRFVRHCLEKNREERFQSARDLAFGLESLSSGSSTSGTPVAADSPNGGGRQRGSRGSPDLRRLLLAWPRGLPPRSARRPLSRSTING